MITSTLTGLASSLLLNAGLAQVAEKLDPVSGQPMTFSKDAHAPALSGPCSFTPKQLRG